MATRTAARVATALVLVAVTTTACSGDDGINEVPVTGPSTAAGSDTPTASDDESPSPTAPVTTPPGGEETPSSPAPTAAPSATDEPEPTDQPDDATPADDAASVGVNARAILRADRPSLVIEIDAQQGVEPDEAAVAHLVSVLEQVADKPAGVRREGVDTFTSTTTTWTTDALRDTATEHRSTATSDDEVSIHVLYVAGSHAEDDGSQTNAIGVAYSASTIAVFPDRWQGLSSMLGSSQAIERAVLVHEVGHLLGLVNLVYTSDIDHEDPDRPGHSDNEGSVMFHAVETTLIGQVFSGPPPSTFDDADLSDLEGLRTGRL